MKRQSKPMIDKLPEVGLRARRLCTLLEAIGREEVIEQLMAEGRIVEVADLELTVERTMAMCAGFLKHSRRRSRRRALS